MAKRELHFSRRRRRSRGRVVILVFALSSILVAAVFVTFFTAVILPGGHTAHKTEPASAGGESQMGSQGTAPLPVGVRLEDRHDLVGVHFNRPPHAGLMFDIDSGQVLWRLHPRRKLPIASLTKMMTGIVVVERLARQNKVRVTKEALAYQGSGMGVLKKDKWISVNTMLHGLLLPSGNDAAIALAQRIARTIPRFVDLMNEKARMLKLNCTRFSSPDGFENKHNHSCPSDLAVVAQVLLRKPWLARIVRRQRAILPFPMKGGKVYLYNHNPLLRSAYRGTIGIKTGYTDLAGRCLVAAVQRSHRRIGVVLLHSPNPGHQAIRLFNAAFKRLSLRRVVRRSRNSLRPKAL